MVKYTVNILCAAMACLYLTSCYKLEDVKPNYDDGRSTVVYDLPGDTLATDGWDDNYVNGDLYLRQRYYNASWTDSIRFVPRGNEIINAAIGVDGNNETGIRWLANAAGHPAAVTENDAYLNTADGYRYIYRSRAWYQMGIDGQEGTAENDSIAINWRGFIQSPPLNPQTGWAYRDNDNNRVYQYNGKVYATITC